MKWIHIILGVSHLLTVVVWWHQMCFTASHWAGSMLFQVSYCCSQMWVWVIQCLPLLLTWLFATPQGVTPHCFRCTTADHKGGFTWYKVTHCFHCGGRVSFWVFGGWSPKLLWILRVFYCYSLGWLFIVLRVLLLLTVVSLSHFRCSTATYLSGSVSFHIFLWCLYGWLCVFYCDSQLISVVDMCVILSIPLLLSVANLHCPTWPITAH